MSANIVVPELGESVVEARVARWLKKEGDRVSVGDPLVELETDKIDLEVGATRDGVLARIARTDGDDVKIGEVLGVIEDAGAAEAGPAERPSPEARKEAGRKEARAEAADQRAAVAEAPAGEAPDAAPPETPGRPERERERPRATPTAQRLAREHQIDLGALTGTGDSGRVTREDVERYVRAQPARPAAPPRPRPVEAPAGIPSEARPAPTDARAEPRPALEARAVARREERVRMSKRRQTIARRLVEAQRTAATLTTFNEADMSAVMALRARRKAAFRERYGVSLGIASFFVKASLAALRDFPFVNAEIQGEEIVVKHYYDIGIAVGAKEGLVVPVLRDADRMSFGEIEQAIRRVAQKAEEGTLSLEDLRGGTFTITNGGVFGSLLSTPILNPPQVAILGLHKIEDRAVPSESQVVIRPMMYLALSYDHRIIDGREAVQFLVRIKELIEDPAILLLDT